MLRRAPLEPPEPLDPIQGRDTCLRCLRPRAHCPCATIRPFELTFDLVLVMHPSERRVPIGTARLAHLAVARSTLIVTAEPDAEPRLLRLLDDPVVFPFVLFPPGDGAPTLDLGLASADIARAFFPASRRPLAVVPDGTWTTARKLVRESARLRSLPRVAFAPTGAPIYDRIRKEPHAHCRSTIEAVHALIEHLGRLDIAPAPAGHAHDQLLAIVSDLVARQVTFEPDGGRATRGPRAPGPGPGREVG